MASRATNENKKIGTNAEAYIARQINGERTPEAWFDVENQEGIHEVKSTQETLTYSNRRGRFRLWKDQHDNLKDHNGTYHFLVDGVGYVTVPPEYIDTLRDQEGRKWTGAGTTGKSPQLKISWRDIMTEDGELVDR